MLSATLRNLRFVLPGALAVAASPLLAQMPDGPGRDETARLCKGCHELARSISLRQDKDGWTNTMNKMVAYGMKPTDDEYAIVVAYLSKAYPADPVPKVNLNTASAIELEAGLTLRRSQARALIAFREAHGPLKSLADLRKVPELDVDRLERKKDRITF